MALEQQTIALIGVGVVIIGVTVGLHSITQADIRALGASIGDIGERVAAIEPRVANIDQSLASIEERVGRVETRLSAVEISLTTVETRLGQVEIDLDAVAVALNTGAEPTGYMVDIVPGRDNLESIGIAVVAEADVVAVDEADVAVVAEAGPEIADYESKVSTYVIVKEKDSSLGNVRRRVTLEIRIDGADPEARTTIETMMQAARNRYELDRLDAVSIRLWRSYEDDSNALNRIVFAPDGCGWSGDDCTGESWTELLKGDIPNG